VGILLSIAPWVVYWILVGNVPIGVSSVVALIVAVVAFGVDRTLVRDKTSDEILGIGALATFLALAVISFSTDQRIVECWLLTLSFAGLFVVTLVSMLIGKPFIRAQVAAGLAADVAKTELFGRIVALLGWIWVAVFGAMTVSASIPSVIDPHCTLFHARAPLAYLCYWVVPTVLLAAGAVASKALPDRMTVGIEDVARSTTFVAFAEAEIDQLLYLASEHANKEVGPGKEAYNVRLGGKGTPLVGDDTRQSWPSTYKVRDKRR
jgi:hypothetical protein